MSSVFLAEAAWGRKEISINHLGMVRCHWVRVAGIQIEGDQESGGAEAS